MQLVCDSESNGFKFQATEIHCIVGFEAETNKLFIGLNNKNKKKLDFSAEIWYKEIQLNNKRAFQNEQIIINTINNNYLINKLFLEAHSKRSFREIVFLQLDEFINLLNLVDIQVWHNGFSHDLPLLKKLYPRYNPKGYEDTFTLSNLFWADRPVPKGTKERHSIEAWGLRFGEEKVKEEDWANFSVNMLIRCIVDTLIGQLTFDKLAEERESWDWEEAIELEYSIALLQGQQEMNGVSFNTPLALEVVDKLDKEIAEIDRELYKQLPMRVVPGTKEGAPFKKDGDLKKRVVDYFTGERGALSNITSYKKKK
jgi:hypothetical protein